MASEITPGQKAAHGAEGTDVLVPAVVIGDFNGQLILLEKRQGTERFTADRDALLRLDDLREVLLKARQALRFDHRLANYPVTDACLACSTTARLDAFLAQLGEAG